MTDRSSLSCCLAVLLSFCRRRCSNFFRVILSTNGPGSTTERATLLSHRSATEGASGAAGGGAAGQAAAGAAAEKTLDGMYAFWDQVRLSLLATD